jgi:hypothetical protein
MADVGKQRDDQQLQTAPRGDTTPLPQYRSMFLANFVFSSIQTFPL